MENINSDQIRYEEAAKKVKKLKGFYTHAIVYLVINIMFVIVNVQNLEPGESKTVSFTFSSEDLKFVNSNNQWIFEPGTFVLQCGNQSVKFELK